MRSRSPPTIRFSWRYEYTIVERPYRIPLNTFGCVLFVIPPSIFLIYLMLIASRMTYVYSAGLCIFGVVFHGFQKLAKHYNWLEYVEAPKRTKKMKIPAAAATSAVTTSLSMEEPAVKR